MIAARPARPAARDRRERGGHRRRRFQRRPARSARRQTCARWRQPQEQLAGIVAKAPRCGEVARMLEACRCGQHFPGLTPGTPRESPRNRIASLRHARCSESGCAAALSFACPELPERDAPGPAEGSGQSKSARALRRRSRHREWRAAPPRRSSLRRLSTAGPRARPCAFRPFRACVFGLLNSGKALLDLSLRTSRRCFSSLIPAP